MNIVIKCDIDYYHRGHGEHRALFLRVLGNRSLHCSTSCVHAVVRVLCGKYIINWRLTESLFRIG